MYGTINHVVLSMHVLKSRLQSLTRPKVKLTGQAKPFGTYPSVVSLFCRHQGNEKLELTVAVEDAR